MFKCCLICLSLNFLFLLLFVIIKSTNNCRIKTPTNTKFPVMKHSGHQNYYRTVATATHYSGVYSH